MLGLSDCSLTLAHYIWWACGGCCTPASIRKNPRNLVHILSIFPHIFIYRHIIIYIYMIYSNIYIYIFTQLGPNQSFQTEVRSQCAVFFFSSSVVSTSQFDVWKPGLQWRIGHMMTYIVCQCHKIWQVEGLYWHALILRKPIVEANLNAFTD